MKQEYELLVGGVAIVSGARLSQLLLDATERGYKDAALSDARVRFGTTHLRRTVDIESKVWAALQAMMSDVQARVSDGDQVGERILRSAAYALSGHGTELADSITIGDAENRLDIAAVALWNLEAHEGGKEPPALTPANGGATMPRRDTGPQRHFIELALLQQFA